MRYGLTLLMIVYSVLILNNRSMAAKPQVEAKTHASKQDKSPAMTLKQSQKVIYEIRSQIMDDQEAKAISLINSYPSLDVNVTDMMGYSLLTEAVINVHLDLVKVLLSRGADPNLEYRRGSVLLIATGNIVGKFVGPAIDQRLYIIAREDDRMLGELAVKEEMEKLRKDKELLQKWYDWHEKRRSDQTAIVRLLLVNGADVNAIDSSGRNALHRVFGEYMPTYAMVDMLLQAGVPLNLKDIKGKTALDYAERAYSYTGEGRKIVRLLKRNGAKKGEDLDTDSFKKPEPKVVDQKQDNDIEKGPSQILEVQGDQTYIYDRLTLATKYVKYIKYNSKPGIYDQFAVKDGKAVTNLINTIWPRPQNIRTKDLVWIKYQGEKIQILEPVYYKNGNIKEGFVRIPNNAPITIGKNELYLTRLQLIEFYPGGQIKAATIKSTKSSEGKWLPLIHAGEKSWHLASLNKVIFSPEGKTLTVINWIKEFNVNDQVWIYIFKMLH